MCEGAGYVSTTPVHYGQKAAVGIINFHVLLAWPMCRLSGQPQPESPQLVNGRCSREPPSVWRGGLVLRNSCFITQGLAECPFLGLALPLSLSLYVWTLLSLEIFLLLYSQSRTTFSGLVFVWVSPTSSLGPSSSVVTAGARPRRGLKLKLQIFFMNKLLSTQTNFNCSYTCRGPPFSSGQHLLLLFWHLHFNPISSLWVHVSELFMSHSKQCGPGIKSVVSCLCVRPHAVS